MRLAPGKIQKIVLIFYALVVEAGAFSRNRGGVEKCFYLVKARAEKLVFTFPSFL